MNKTKILIYSNQEQAHLRKRKLGKPMPPIRLCFVIRHKLPSSIVVEYAAVDLDYDDERMQVEFADTVPPEVLVEFIRSNDESAKPLTDIRVFNQNAEIGEYTAVRRLEEDRDRFFVALKNLLPLISSSPVILGETVILIKDNKNWKYALKQEREFEETGLEWKKRKIEEEEQLVKQASKESRKDKRL